jgi:hypothetical protein
MCDIALHSCIHVYVPYQNVSFLLKLLCVVSMKLMPLAAAIHFTYSLLYACS